MRSPDVVHGSAPRGAAERASAAVITVSDRSSRGERADTTGPAIAAALAEAGFTVGEPTIVPDDEAAVRDAVQHAHAAGARIIVTTGGTGIGPRDRTPEAVRPLLDLELPAMAAALAAQPAAPPTALLSRAVAGVIGAPAPAAANHTTAPPHAPRPALVVTLPGSAGGVRDGLAVLLPLAHHAIVQLDGSDHEPPHTAPDASDRPR